MSGQSAASDGPMGWWQRPAVIAAVIALSALPLLYPKIPPLVDLLGHMGRYRVELDVDRSQWLGRYYGFHWAAIGNLGVDLLVIPLSRLFGLELAVKLIVVAIPPVTVGGFLWVAREVHGRIPPTAFFALPFAYAHPFLYGFANYALSMALAFLAFALWLRLTRRGATTLRAFLFVPVSITIFFAHTYGWGVLGLLCFSAELVRQHDRSGNWLRSIWNAGLAVSVMALPVAIMLAWRSDTGAGMTGDWFNWQVKLQWLAMVLRDRWRLWDVASLIIALLVLVEARSRPWLGYSRNLAFSASVLLAGYLVLPRIIFGSAYADMRLIPYVIAVALLAIRMNAPIDRKKGAMLAAAGLAFFGLRIASTTASLAIAANDQQSKLAAIDHMPMGSRVVSLVGSPCAPQWALNRNTHLGAMVVVRKQGFSNDQWTVEGANLLELRYSAAGAFAADPSQFIVANGCRTPAASQVDAALEAVPRQAFDFVWLIDPPQFDEKAVAGMQMVWRGPGSILYRTH